MAHSGIIKILKGDIDAWKSVPDEKIKFQRLGGLSNVLWKVSVEDEDVKPSRVIYRRFGEATELVNRDKENHIYEELAGQDLGPKCYGFSSKYRIEQFYDFIELKPTDVHKAKHRRNIAKTLAGMHALDLKELTKYPRFRSIIEEKTLHKGFEKKLKNTEFNEKEKEQLKDIEKLVDQEETDFILKILPTSKKSLVFSHNDLHVGNIMYLEDKQKYLMIDCEYSSYNYRGFDLANLAIECMFDYTNKEHPFYNFIEDSYLKSSDLNDLAKYYLFFYLYGDKFSREEADKIIEDESLLEKHIKENGNEKDFNDELEELLDEVRVCSLVSHYYWIIWSIMFSKNPDMDFDYIHYAHKRLGLYQKAKQIYLDHTNNKSK